MKKRILGAGLVAVDHIFLSYDRRRASKNNEYLGSAGGGTIPNTLCLLSLLGYDTHIFGLTGNDVCERIVKSDLSDFGVNYHFLKKKGCKRRFTYNQTIFSHY